MKSEKVGNQNEQEIKKVGNQKKWGKKGNKKVKNKKNTKIKEIKKQEIKKVGNQKKQEI